MSIDEKAMRFLEEYIPELAKAALTQAYWQALAAGSSALTCENGAIYEVFSDDASKAVKSIEPPIPCPLGQKITLK